MIERLQLVELPDITRITSGYFEDSQEWHVVKQLWLISFCRHLSGAGLLGKRGGERSGVGSFLVFFSGLGVPACVGGCRERVRHSSREALASADHKAGVFLPRAGSFRVSW